MRIVAVLTRTKVFTTATSGPRHARKCLNRHHPGGRPRSNPGANPRSRVKGPQGTLYGDGSVGGTVRYITNKPVLDAFQMLADVRATFVQYGAPGDRVDTVLNVPVISDKLGLRVAADLDHEGGWVDQPAAHLKNINSNNLADVRLEGRWRPAADFTVDAMQEIHRDTSGPYTGENPIGFYTQVFNLTTTPQIEDNYDISNITLNWSPGALTVANSATYFHHFLNEANFGAYLPVLPPPLPALNYTYNWLPTIDEGLSNELRLQGSEEGRWHWTLGWFFKRLDTSTPLSYASIGLPIAPGSALPAPFSTHSNVFSKSNSVFGDTNYRLLGRLVVGAGVRYFRDDESALLVGDAAQENATFTSIDPRFYLRYGISRQINVYASAAKGFRSGGFNGLGYPPYRPESVWTYDLGTKARLLGGRVHMDADVFFSNYGAYQMLGLAPPPNPPLNIIRNAGEARVKGVESEFMWSPSDRWRLALNGDYVDARIETLAVLQSDYNVGDPLDFVPRYQATASAEREFEWEGRSGFLRMDYTQRAREPFRNRSIGPWFYSQSDYMYLLAFHAGIDWTQSLHLGFFVQNLLNDRGYTGPESIESHAAREQPRTFGVDFGVRFE